MIKDPYLLLSVVNTALRDGFSSLEDYALYEGVSIDEIVNILSSIGYAYDKESNSFK